MKKILSLLLAVVFAFGLIACSDDVVTNDVVTNDPDLVRIVNEEGQAFEDAFKSSFEESSDMTCDCNLYVAGTSLIADCLIQGIDNLPEETKTQMQELYDGMKDTLKSSFEPFKEEAPNLSNVIFNVREEDGDIIATIDVEF